MNGVTIFLIALITPIEKVGELMFNRAVLYGFLTAVIVFSSFLLGKTERSIAYLRKSEELRTIAPITVTDRNGVILYKTTVSKYEAHLPPAEEYKRAPAFVDFVLKQLKDKYGDDPIKNGVYIRTTLDISLQNAALESVLEQSITQNSNTDGSVVVTDPKTNDILVYVNAIHYYDTSTKIYLSKLLTDDKLNPFMSIIDSSGAFLYKNRKAGSDTLIDKDKLAVSPEWSSDNNQVVAQSSNLKNTDLRIN